MSTPSTIIPELSTEQARGVMEDAMRCGRVVYFAGNYYYEDRARNPSLGPYLTAGRALILGYMDTCCRQTLQQIDP
jgi:hypothetical protein